MKANIFWTLQSGHHEFNVTVKVKAHVKIKFKLKLEVKFKIKVKVKLQGKVIVKVNVKGKVEARNIFNFLNGEYKLHH